MSMQMQTQVPSTPSSTPVSTGVLQRKCACGAAGMSGECSACRAKPGRLQRRPASGDALGLTSAPPIVHEVLRSPGQPLDPGARAIMAARFGHSFGQVQVHPSAPALSRSGLTIGLAGDEREREADRVADRAVASTGLDHTPHGVPIRPLVDLGRVRIHTDARAAESARAVDAAAYTVGEHMVFGAGRYAPSSVAGQRLLAHELTHVAQQSAGGEPMVARQLAPTPGYTEDQQAMLRCMAQPLQAGVMTDEEKFARCAQVLGYRGEFFAPTVEDVRQIRERTPISDEDLQAYRQAVQDYQGWVEAGEVPLAAQEDISRRIDTCQRLLAALNPDYVTDKRSVAKTRTEVAALPAIAALGVTATRTTAAELVAKTALERAAASWGASALVPEAVAGVGLETGAVVTGAGVETGSALGVGAAIAEVVLPIAAIALAAYLTYRFIRWLDSLRPEPVQVEPYIPDTIRDATRRIRQVPRRTPAPAQPPQPVPIPNPRRRDDDRRRRRCRYPTGLSENDPIEMTWFKYRHDYFYPATIAIEEGVLSRDDPNTRLPDGTRIGVRAEQWPECNKIYRYIPTRRGSRAREYRELLQRWGYDWRQERTQPDHIQDLAWNGPDDFGNLWPYEQSTNASTGSTQNLQQRISFCPTPNGNPIVNERIVWNRNYLYGRYFIIKRFRLHSDAPDLITCP